MRRPDLPVLTTLRFPAAVAIVLFHFLAYTSLPAWIWSGFNSGVSFFYVLSGFILYYNYEDLTDRKFFWTARFARIWPIHIFTLFVALIALPFVWQEGHASWPVTLPANILLLHAWLPFQGSCFSYNGVSWSLSVEAFFYLCFPWLLASLKRMGSAPVLLWTYGLGLALILAAMVLLPSHAQWVGSCNPCCRVFEFALGMCTGRWWMRRTKAPGSNVVSWSLLEGVLLLGVGAMTVVMPAVASLAAQAQPLQRWLGTSTSAIFFALLIWTFAHQRGAISRFLSARPFEWLGEISFSLYMCHQIVLRWLNFQETLDMVHAVERFAVYLAACLIISAGLFHFVEVPARRALLTFAKGRKQSSASV